MSSIGSLINTSLLKCRGCLVDSGEMKNMLEWGLCDDFYKLTDIKINRSDGLTELLCISCEDALKKCKSFRIQCLKSDLILKDKKFYTNTSIENQLLEKDNGDKTETEDVKVKENFMKAIINETEIIILMMPIIMETRMNIPCPFECKKSYNKPTDLILHLKKHNVKPDINLKLQYYCPYIKCPYFINSNKNKHFKERKLLNQHLHKVHCKKSFTCKLCSDSFVKEAELLRHTKTCNDEYKCVVCNLKYQKKEAYIVHLLRKHPDLHKEYKLASKRLRDNKKSVAHEAKKYKSGVDDSGSSPKRSFATQTLSGEDMKCVKNDISLYPNDQEYTKGIDDMERHFSTIQTQTVFEDLLSIKSQNSEDDSLFPDSVSDIHTQTWSNKTNSDSTIKETQTCLCLYDSKSSLPKYIFNSASSSPTTQLTSTETQTSDGHRYTSIKSDVLLSFSSTETQTCFEEANGF